MKRIILDTNMLMVPGSVGVDIGSELDRICNFEYRMYVLQATIDELKKLAEGNSKTARNAKLGLSIIDQTNISIIRKKGYADDLLVKEAQKPDTIIATQDADLKRRLKALALPHIILRQKSYLALVE